ncbi:glycerophosphodiester phosphodiesterase family protein [Hwangdonia lutea]|uniref:Glycerophosphodiester phosphodiesterase family protein n=1 Tax=Hwangdonia lutea TaxID=3075823 RepID=A0AA97HQZ9_9FLAO|nr:glycerophosphodiester phosphodiesterase family protein [Hwangdonia sp. SCSIO 19198]WOD42918.1 glycerophosphodiester phosphodiesterase family protein [Hwangdonia sp. SCSIO 19198]
MNCNESKNIDIQGHRGCRGLMPENTMEAFKKAIELGVQTLELDVAISKDNIVVVSHEPYMNPVICLDANGSEIPKSDEKKYNLYQMTFDSIKQFDCGTKHHPRFPNQQKIKTHKPALSEVIIASKKLNPNIKFNIEIKYQPDYNAVFTPNPKDFVRLVLDVINKNDAFNETNLQSFDLSILEEIKKQSPKMEVALLVDENEDIWNKMNVMSYWPEIISPYYKLLNAKTVRNLQAENFKVIPWTVNSKTDMRQMIDFKVDGIITDYPDILIDVLKN